ncbi:MAG TPA: SBBP repeat-containing protein [Bryobacteraceae bacterium]|nr:SBBP repeat-containing protein [Bryobacteraceae bacterium]
MRTICGALLQLLFSISLTFGQALINHRVLSGNGSDQPAVIATDSSGFIYVAGNTTSGNFPVTNALEAGPPQGALEVSINGAAFVNSGLIATSVNAVAASSDGSLVIASTSGGIMRSTDQGVTWTAAADVLPPASALAVDPVNPSNCYALLLQSGELYKSANAGVNWQNTGASFPSPTAMSQIAINPQTPTTMYLLCGYVVYRSTDGAQSWQPLSIPNSNNSISAIALAPSQPNVLYASASSIFGPVFQSSDGGSTWTPGATNVFAYGPTAMAVDPTNPSTLWLVNGGGDIFKSTDSGASFQIVTTLSGTQTLFSVAIDPANPSHVYAAAGGWVSQTLDGGQTWSGENVPVSTLYAAPSRIYTVGGNTPQTVFLAKLDAALSNVIYSTYLWTGTASGIALDAAGDVYLVGSDSTGFNGMAMKVSANDSSVLYSQTLNGAVPNAVAIDMDGNAVIAGTASSLPVTKGAYQTTIPGPCTIQPNLFNAFPNQESTHAFVAKLNGTGALVDATYITGSCGDSAFALALDSSGDVYVAGETYSSDFPVTADAMIAQFPSTYTAGFIAKLSSAEDQLLYSSFIGGGYFSVAHALALDGAGNVYLAGSTQASPTPGAAHALSGGGCPSPGINFGPPLIYPPVSGDNPFVMKMTLSAAPPVFLATLGGTCQGEADSIAFDAAGNIWLGGLNVSWDFPTVAPIGGLAQIPPELLRYYNPQMGFLAELNPAASAVLNATATDSFGSVSADSTAVYYAGGLGDLNASGSPTLNYAALVAEIDPTQAARIFIDEITQYSPLVPAANRLPSAVAPGEVMRILGRGIGPQNPTGALLTAAGTLAASIGGVQVTFNGVPAPLVSARAGEVDAIAPFELNGLSSAPVQVEYNGLTSNTYTVLVVPQNPDVLAVANSDWSANSVTNPAHGGEVAIFLTGLGQTSPPGVDGAINRLPLAQPIIMPTVTNNTGNYSVTVAFLGAAPYEVEGVSQLNLMLSGELYNSVFDLAIGAAPVAVYAAP